MKIGIYGSAAPDMDQMVMRTAEELGEEIARRKNVVITGACPGIPHIVAHSAFTNGTQVIGYSPSCNKEQHVAEGMPEGAYTELVFLTDTAKNMRMEVRYKMRNITSVDACDCAIFISGRVGTLNEYTLAYDLLKPFGALTGTGGAADALEQITKLVPKDPKPFMCFSDDYRSILDQLERAVAKQNL